MPVDRFFTHSPLKTPLLTLEGEQLRHLHVMRLRPGETLELVNGRGELLSSSKTQAEIKITSHETALPPPPLILAQGITRTLDWIIEKGTELGVTEFWLFPTDRSEKKTAPLSRLETLAISSLKQCGRLFLPKILLKPPLTEWDLPSGSLFFGDLSPEAPRLRGPFSSPTLFFIGPDKGFSSSEIQILSSTFKAKPISLHENTLRAETAAVAVLAQYFVEK